MCHDTVKKTTAEWLAISGGEILDDDGWRTDTAPLLDEPITAEEFRQRYSLCTAYNGPGLKWPLA